MLHYLRGAGAKSTRSREARSLTVACAARLRAPPPAPTPAPLVQGIRCFLGRRCVVSFGRRYDFSGSELHKAVEIPGYSRNQCAYLTQLLEAPPGFFQTPQVELTICA